LIRKNIEDIRSSPCNGCTQKVVLYGQTKEQTEKTKPKAKANFVERLSSTEIQKITIAVREMNNEFANNPTEVIGVIDNNRPA
jgi:hypothetical protein